METLELLGTGLGLATLAGINLYLTVFVTGLAVRMGWISLAPEFAPLAILADPVVLTISGLLFFFEFFADKVPWVDSAWDSVHTVIRPIGGAMLAIMALGDANPVFEVVVGLLGGGAALCTHAAKATGRLVINASPEPFSNVGASVGEDAAVLGGLALLVWNPVLGLLLAFAVITAFGFFGPRVLRCLVARFRFAGKKLTQAAASDEPHELTNKVPVDVDCLLHKELPGEVRVGWSVEATTGKVPGFPSNIHGVLFGVENEPGKVFFSGKVWFRPRLLPLPLTGVKTAYEKGFLFDRMTLYRPSENRRWIFCVDRSSRASALQVTQRIEEMQAAISEGTESESGSNEQEVEAVA